MVLDEAMGIKRSFETTNVELGGVRCSYTYSSMEMKPLSFLNLNHSHEIADISPVS